MEAAVNDEKGASAPALGAQGILAAEDRVTEPLDMTEEWGGVLYIRSLPYATVQGMYGKLETTKDGEAAMSIDLVRHVPAILRDGCVTEAGQPLFTPQQAEQVAKEKSFPAVMKVVNAILSMSSLGTDGAEEVEGN